MCRRKVRLHMARKSLLSAAIERPQAEANENTIPQPVADAVRAEAKRPNSNAGKYHLGGYFDQDDPTAEAFRVLRSEEHTSELQSLMRISYAVFCLKKKTTQKSKYHNY